MFFIGMVVGIALALLLVLVVFKSQMLVIKQSNLSFHETVDTIDKSATDLNWGVPHKYDLQSILKGKGYEVNPVTVFSLCKPNIANQVLSNNNDRHISAILPCRMAVYEKKGKIFISYLNTGFIAKFAGRRIKPLMEQVNAEMNVIIRQFVK